MATEYLSEIAKRDVIVGELANKIVGLLASHRDRDESIAAHKIAIIKYLLFFPPPRASIPSWETKETTNG